jgi:hypothetical protein
LARRKKQRASSTDVSSAGSTVFDVASLGLEHISEIVLQHVREISIARLHAGRLLGDKAYHSAELREALDERVTKPLKLGSLRF